MLLLLITGQIGVLLHVAYVVLLVQRSWLSTYFAFINNLSHC